MWRALGLQDATLAERRAAFWIAVMAFAAMAGPFVLRPLRDQFGVNRGVEHQPYLYSLTLLATVVAVLPFWWLANRLPSRRFVPIVLHVCTLAALALAAGLMQIGDYDWKQLPWLGEVFWAGFSTLNVAVPALVWIHAVETFDRAQAKRLFGLIAVGATAGTATGSSVALWLAKSCPLWASAAATALLLQLAFVAFLVSRRYCGFREGAGERVSAGGLLGGLRILRRDGYVRRIGVYMMLLGVLATAFYVAQTELVGEAMTSGKDQHKFLANIEMWGQSFVLVLQLFCTGALMRRVPTVWLLISLPLISIVGLAAWWLWPTALAIFFVQVGRRGAQYALEKPAREALYTPLELETKHKVKFLLDTFAFRLGDLIGACLQVALRRFELQVGSIVLVTATVALLWIALAFSLQRWRRRELSGS